MGDKIRWKKIPRETMSLSRINMITIFAPSPDPFLTAQFFLEGEPILDMVARERERCGKKITVTTVVLKLLALAVDKNREFNSLVFGRDVYELTDIRFTIPYLLPGDAHELTNLIVDSPHLKSLEQIHDECEAMMKKAKATGASKSRKKSSLIPSLIIRSGLHRLIGEKLAYRILHERGLGSNLVLTNASIRGTGRLYITKGAVQILRAFTRFYLHGAEEIPVADNGQISIKKRIPISIAFDHRLVDGIHLNNFIGTLQQILDDGNFSEAVDQ